MNEKARQRKFLPTTAELIDRLCIVTLKSIKIAGHKEAYEAQAAEIMHDLDLILGDDRGRLILAIQLNAIANETIWANESKAREGKEGQDHLLKFTHSVNGVRTSSMNAISVLTGERRDLKVDCIAAEACKLNGYDFGGIVL